MKIPHVPEYEAPHREEAAIREVTDQADEATAAADVEAEDES